MPARRREAFGYYPADHAGGGEILRQCGRGMVFGDVAFTRIWQGDPRIEVHGPGYSKIVIGEDCIDDWEKYLDVMVASILENSGRSLHQCVGRVGAAPCARQSPRRWPRDWPRSCRGMRRTSRRKSRRSPMPAWPGAFRQMIDGDLDARRPRCHRRATAAAARWSSTRAALTCCRPLSLCDSPAHPLANREFLFPFASVVPVRAGRTSRARWVPAWWSPRSPGPRADRHGCSLRPTSGA